MTDYQGVNEPPWPLFKIKAVIIENGVTSIGSTQKESAKELYKQGQRLGNI